MSYLVPGYVEGSEQVFCGHRAVVRKPSDQHQGIVLESQVLDKGSSVDRVFRLPVFVTPFNDKSVGSKKPHDGLGEIRREAGLQVKLMANRCELWPVPDLQRQRLDDPSASRHLRAELCFDLFGSTSLSESHHGEIAAGRHTHRARKQE